MSFASDVARFCKVEAPEYVDKVVKQTMLAIHQSVDSRSPVGNPLNWSSPGSAPPGYVGGRFRMNWQYGFGSQPTSEIEGVDPQGNSARSRVRSQIMLADGVGVHYLVNNLPYARRIEDGWSHTQAPQGVAALTELEFPQIFERAKRG